MYAEGTLQANTHFSVNYYSILVSWAGQCLSLKNCLPEPVVLKPKCASKSPGRLVKTLVSGYHIQSFWFSRSGDAGWGFIFLTSSQVKPILLLQGTTHWKPLAWSIRKVDRFSHWSLFYQGHILVLFIYIYNHYLYCEAWNEIPKENRYP